MSNSAQAEPKAMADRTFPAARAVDGVTPVVTDSGIEVAAVYTASDLEPGLEERLGEPGEPPYTRGVHPTMYRDRLWTMRLYSGLDAPEDTNKRFKFLLDQGQTGLSVAFDLPTQMGYDPDARSARHEVGRTGVSVCTVKDMEAIFDGIPLDKISTSFTINATAPIILAFYVLVAERQGVPRSKIAGTIQNDILKEFTSRKAYIYPPEPSLRFVIDAMEFCAQELPKFNSISVCGYHMRQAGSDAVQEVGFTIANALVYAEGMIKRGYSIDDFAPRISFNFSVMSELFEEVAKLRAARRIWARLVTERFHPKDKRSQMLRFFSGGDGTSLTSIEPLNNVVRVTMHQLGIILAGAQAVHTVAYDEAIGLPTEQSALLALRTQQILAHETGVTKTVDPLAGSYYVEHLTDQIDKRATALIEQVESNGGMPELIEKGWVQSEIDERAYHREVAIATGEQAIVGVNCYQNERAHGEVHVDHPRPELGERQIARVQAQRINRDNLAVENALTAVHAAASGTTNSMPSILAAADAGATVGEISDTLRDVWGTFAEPVHR